MKSKTSQLKWTGKLSPAEVKEFQDLLKDNVTLDSKQIHRFRNLRSRYNRHHQKPISFVIVRRVQIVGEGYDLQDMVEIEEGVFDDRSKAETRCNELNKAVTRRTEHEELTGDLRYALKAIPLIQ